MADVSIIIPVASYHEDIAQHAIASAQAQTTPCEVIVIRDTDSRGPAWARNQGLAQVNANFVVFLDADDTIDRAFVARCLSVWKPYRYVYTDWMEGKERRGAPDCPFVDGSWHVVTTLIPTAYARRVGGFDETLPGAEDTQFYLRLMSAGYCGLKLALPLFVYGEGGQRAKTFVNGDAFERVVRDFKRDYVRNAKMACCGQNEDMEVPPAGEQQMGDVLAMALWAGNRQERGRVSGRLYPRTGNGKTVWVDPRDVAARPDLWRTVAAEPDDEDDEYPDALEVIGDVFGTRAPATPLAATKVKAQPDFGRVLDAGKAAFNPEMPLGEKELNALREGHELDVTAKGVKINRKRKPDTFTPFEAADG